MSDQAGRGCARAGGRPIPRGSGPSGSTSKRAAAGGGIDIERRGARELLTGVCGDLMSCETLTACSGHSSRTHGIECTLAYDSVTSWPGAGLRRVNGPRGARLRACVARRARLKVDHGKTERAAAIERVRFGDNTGFQTFAMILNM